MLWVLGGSNATGVGSRGVLMLYSELEQIQLRKGSRGCDYNSREGVGIAVEWRIKSQIVSLSA